MIEFITNNYDDVTKIFGYVVGIASIIVKFTPTQKDNNILDKVVSILAHVSLFNKDGSSSK